MPGPQKICHQSIVLLSEFLFCDYLSLNSSAGGLMVFSAFQWFLCLKQTMIQTILLVLGQNLPSKNTPKQMTVCFVAVKSKAERKKSYSTADSSSRKRNGLAPCSQQLSGQQSYFGTFPFKEGGGEGAGSEFLHSLFCLLNNTARSDLV